MGYRRLGHTADAGLELRAETLPDLFNQAVRGFTDTVVELSAVEENETVAVACSAADPELLLVACLDELVYEFEVHGRVFARAEAELVQVPEEWRLHARLLGELYDADRHRLRIPVKGVTYHRLELVETECGWLGTVIFDI